MDERIAIGVAVTGTFAPATRVQAREYLESAVKADLSTSTKFVTDSRIELARNIKASLANTSTPTVKEPVSG